MSRRTNLRAGLIVKRLHDKPTERPTDGQTDMAIELVEIEMWTPIRTLKIVLFVHTV